MSNDDKERKYREKVKYFLDKKQKTVIVYFIL